MKPQIAYSSLQGLQNWLRWLAVGVLSWVACANKKPARSR